jgi:hypothetical protein
MWCTEVNSRTHARSSVSTANGPKGNHLLWKTSSRPGKHHPACALELLQLRHPTAARALGHSCNQKTLPPSRSKAITEFSADLGGDSFCGRAARSAAARSAVARSAPKPARAFVALQQGCMVCRRPLAALTRPPGPVGAGGWPRGWCG